MKQILFTLTSARSGTLYLRNLFRRNLKDCICRHEPFFDWGNPTLFGRAIYDAQAGHLDRIRALLAKKRRYIDRLPGRVYLESSHAFLKSAYVAAREYFPEMRLIHLIRNPLKVAKSEAYREAWRRRFRAPFHYYTGGDGRRHFAWALTGNEDIFRHFDLARLSLFQRYLIQWIEIENRAMRFLESSGLQSRCFTLHSPRDLNDASRIRTMFAYFGLAPAEASVRFGGRRNKSLGRSNIVTEHDEEEGSAVLQAIPASYLEIFQREPYTQYSWSKWLWPQALRPSQAERTPM